MLIEPHSITSGRQGEIIPPGAGVDVYFRPSPFRSQAHHLRVSSGLTVAEIISDAGAAFGAIAAGSPVYVSINGHAIERANWRRVRVKPGVTVNIVRVPGKGAIRAVVSVVVAIVATIVAPYLVGALLPGLTGVAATAVTGLVAAGLTIAGSLAINALFPVAQNESVSDNTKTLYSIGGAQNQASQYGAIPTVFGTHRISPPYAAGGYTEIAGDDQYLRLLFCLGYGPMAISDVRIGETPIASFEGVSYEVIENHLVDPPTLYTRPVYEEDVGTLLDFASSWVQRTTADNVNSISVDVSFPGGVYRYQSSDGKKVNYTVTVQVQYRTAGAGSWLTAGTVTITDNSSQAFRRTVGWAVAAGQYDVRVRKSTADYSGSDTVSEAVYWTAVRGRRNVSVLNFDKPLSIIAMRIKATNELSGTVDQLNCIVSPRIRKWNGSSWVAGQTSRWPADHFRHVLQGDANARPVADTMIDLDGLQQWHAYCVSHGFTFDYVSTTQKSIYETLTMIAAAGRAAVSMRDGKWGVVWDVADSPIVQHFTPRNSWGFSSIRGYADLPHGFRVPFINRDNGYLNDERVVYDDGYNSGNATKFEGLDFPGVVTPDLIWKHGRYHLAQLRLQRESYSLTTDFESLICTRGDRVRVNHDLVLWGAGAGRVKSVSSSPDVVVIDDHFVMEAGKTYSMRFRLADGSSLVRLIEGVDGEFSSFTLSGTDALPAVGDLALFGENGFESVVLRVKSITPQADLCAKLELVDDAPEIMNADTGDIPEFATGIAGIIDYTTFTPSQFSYTEEVWSTAPATSLVRASWQAPEGGKVSSYIIRYRQSGGSLWINLSSQVPAIEIPDITFGSYDIWIRAVYANGRLSGWLKGGFVATIFATAPQDVQNFRISVAGDIATLQWDNVTSAVLAGYEIRYSPVTSGVTWSSAVLLNADVPGNLLQTAAMPGTYLIKARTWGGLFSANASLIISTVDPTTSLNAVEALAEGPVFSGVKTDVYQADDGLRLDFQGDVYALADVYAPADIFLSGGGYQPVGTYAFADIIDLGDVYTSRLTAEIHAYGELSSVDIYGVPDLFALADVYSTVAASLWSVGIEISTTNDDPLGAPSWSDFAAITTGDVSARAYRFRAVLRSGQFDVTPIVTGMTVYVDMPDRVIAGDDLVVTTSGRSIAFDPPYKKLQGVSISAQGLQTGDYYQITGKTEAGFTIIFRNAAGVAIERTLDYVAKGYGAIQ